RSARPVAPARPRRPRCGAGSDRWARPRDRAGAGSRVVRRCRSSACGVGFTDPPSVGAVAAPTALPAEGPARRIALRLLAAELRPLRAAVPPPAELLDVGAGGGLRTLVVRRLGDRATAPQPHTAEAGPPATPPRA